jgi:hypothetical protein
MNIGEPGGIRTPSNTFWRRTPLASRDSDSCGRSMLRPYNLEEGEGIEPSRLFTPSRFRDGLLVHAARLPKAHPGFGCANVNILTGQVLTREHWRPRSELNRNLMGCNHHPSSSGSRSKYSPCSRSKYSPCSRSVLVEEAGLEPA